jgi:hypothetical protein
MDVNESFLTPAHQIKESEVLAECSRLMLEERSRYESQATVLLETGTFSSQKGNYLLRYKMEDDRFAWHANSTTATENSYSGQAPIPDSESARLETLVELFAHSEAGFIS